MQITDLATALRLTAGTLALAGALPAGAEVACPDTIEVAQQASAPGRDWNVTVSPPPYKLVGITIWDGPQSQNRRVKPRTAGGAGGELRLTWHLPPSRRNYHLVCDYERTAANLTTALPPGITECSAVFDRRVSYGIEGLAVKRMVCR